MVSFTHRGSLDRTERFLKNIDSGRIFDVIKPYAERGVQALSAATPIDTGKTAASWSYTIEVTPNQIIVHWVNSNRVDGVPIALVLQYGHGTRFGGYVQGRDYINPAIRPIFDQMEQAVWREVTKI